MAMGMSKFVKLHFVIVISMLLKFAKSPLCPE